MELRKFAEENNLSDHVTFVRSFSDKERVAFLRYSTCLLYTPSNEHFGLVPIEAMCMKCPVIACNSGGPLETVLNDVTGFLCDPNPLAFSTAMKKIVEKKDAREIYGNAGFSHVMENFSFEKFSDQLDKSVSFSEMLNLIIYVTVIKLSYRSQTKFPPSVLFSSIKINFHVCALNPLFNAPKSRLLFLNIKFL